MLLVSLLSGSAAVRGCDVTIELTLQIAVQAGCNDFPTVIPAVGELSRIFIFGST